MHMYAKVPFVYASACVCVYLESQDSPQGAAGKGYMLGSRNNQLGRFFRGQLSELLVYPRALNTSELVPSSSS